MITSRLFSGHKRELKILCVGAHCDDIEIGCGGTILKILESGKKVEIRWVILSSVSERQKEAKECAARFLDGAGESKIEIFSFRDGYFPYNGGRIKDEFETFSKAFNPDVIFTHFHADAHQDHRLVNQLTWNCFRNHVILEYEIPKYDGDLGRPNAYVELSAILAKKKINLIINGFQSQANKHWFSAETFQAALRIRGVECRASEGFAEAFYCRKLLLT